MCPSLPTVRFATVNSDVSLALNSFGIVPMMIGTLISITSTPKTHLRRGAENIVSRAEEAPTSGLHFDAKLVEDPEKALLPARACW